jgi:nucleotide-binding universal stress UspA family protein
VFDTGRPTLILPKAAPSDPLNHVMIALNSSIEATRAVAGAMPLLRHAKQVSIFTAPAHTDEAIKDLYLGEQLAWHGIRSHYLSLDIDAHSVGAALLEAARAERATMIVMGAYTHSRVREMLLGGVTRHILKHTAVPVLMMH